MIKAGDLVNNIHTSDYNHGVVLEIGLSVTNEMYMQDESELKLVRESQCPPGESWSLLTEPDGVRVMWECGNINIHYSDELENIRE